MSTTLVPRLYDIAIASESYTGAHHPAPFQPHSQSAIFSTRGSTVSSSSLSSVHLIALAIHIYRDIYSHFHPTPEMCNLTYSRPTCPCPPYPSSPYTVLCAEARQRSPIMACLPGCRRVVWKPVGMCPVCVGLEREGRERGRRGGRRGSGRGV